MAELKGALIICDRCNLSTFNKLGEYDSVEIPSNWNRAHFGTCLQTYNLCPECYEELKIIKDIFFSESVKTQGGRVVWNRRDDNGKE